MVDYHPKLWGPQGWILMEYSALGFPDKPTEEDKKRYKTFFESVAYTLPCSECRENYQKHIKELPIDEYLINSNALYYWVIEMKNKVNKSRGKDKVAFEKERKRKVNKNYELQNAQPKKRCCGAKKISESDRKKQRLMLESRRRTRKALLDKIKVSREVRKQKRKK